MIFLAVLILLIGCFFLCWAYITDIIPSIILFTILLFILIAGGIFIITNIPQNNNNEPTVSIAQAENTNLNDTILIVNIDDEKKDISTVYMVILIMIFLVTLWMSDSVLVALLACWVCLNIFEVADIPEIELPKQVKSQSITQISPSEHRHIDNRRRSKVRFYLKNDGTQIIATKSKDASLPIGSFYDEIINPTIIQHSSGVLYACDKKITICHPINE